MISIAAGNGQNQSTSTMGKAARGNPGYFQLAWSLHVSPGGKPAIHLKQRLYRFIIAASSQGLPMRLIPFGKFGQSERPVSCYT